MQSLIDKLGWKKIAFIAIGVSILGFLYMLISFANEGSSKPGSVSTITPQNTDSTTGIGHPIQNTPNKNPGSSVGKTTNGSKTPGNAFIGKTYSSPDFQVSYPSNFTITASGSTTDESSYLSLVNGSTTLEVISYDSSKKTMDSLSQMFKALGYQPSNITVGSIRGIGYEGVLKDAQVYEKIAIFQKENRVIKIQLIQPGGSTDESKQAFEAVVNSFE